MFLPSGARDLVAQLTAACFAYLFVIGAMLYRLPAGKARRLAYVCLAATLALALRGPHWAPVPLSGPAFTGVIGGMARLVWLARLVVPFDKAAEPVRPAFEDHRAE